MRVSGSWRFLSLSMGLAVSLLSEPVFAQSAEANVLFDEARTAMASHDYAQAISKLQQSQALDPSAGTLLNLAECYVAVGRTASAWSTYRDAASLAFGSKQPDRERYAARRAQELEPQLSRLELTVPPASRASGLVVKRNGISVPEGLWGAPIPVDPGEQRVEASAPGRMGWSAVVVVPAGVGKTPLEVPELAVEVAPATSAPPTVAPLPSPSSGPPSAALSPLPIVGWSAIGAGAVATGVGVVVYLNGRGKIDDANCPDQVCVRGVGNKGLHDSGRAGERLGVGLGVVGVVAVASGVVLLLVAPSRTQAASLQLNVAGSGLRLSGSW